MIRNVELPAGELCGESEGAVYPAEGVEKVSRDPRHVAVDGAAEVLLGGLQEARHHQEQEGDAVVEPKRRVVNQTILQSR